MCHLQVYSLNHGMDIPGTVRILQCLFLLQMPLVLPLYGLKVNDLPDTNYVIVHEFYFLIFSFLFFKKKKKG
jgi:hypothetical protein